MKKFQFNVFDAVLNRHINNAGHLAKLAFIQMYGQAMWDQHMLIHERSNMTLIFKSQATLYNTFYVLTVMSIVNTGRV